MKNKESTAPKYQRPADSRRKSTPSQAFAKPRPRVDPNPLPMAPKEPKIRWI